MFYTVYKTTNSINGKFYIGKHQTNDPYDSYLGSGVLLRAAIDKYGRENFKKEVLFIFNTEEEMNFKEIELASEEIVSNPMSYNIGVGGEGGPHFSGKNHSDSTRKLLRDIAFRAGKHVSEETRKKISENNWSKRDPQAQREHAKNAGAKAKRNPSKISESLIDYYSNREVANKGRKFPLVICPHCLKEGASNAMKRYHFDNCKSKCINK